MESSQLTRTCKTFCWVLKDCVWPCPSGSRSVQFLWSDAVRIQLRTNWIIPKSSSVMVICYLNPANWNRIDLKSALRYILHSFSYIPPMFYLSLCIMHLFWPMKGHPYCCHCTESPFSSKFLLTVIILQAPCGDLCVEVPVPLCHTSLPVDVYPLSWSIKL